MSAEALPAALAALARQARPLRVPAGTVLFHAGQACPGFPIVDEGSVAVSLTAPDGRSLELYRVEPGEVCVVSATCLFAHRVATAQGEARTDTALRLVTPADFEAVCEQDPVLRRYVMGLMAERMADLMALVEAVAFQRLEIVSRLLRRFEREGCVALGRERVEVRDGAGLQGVCAASNPV